VGFAVNMLACDISCSRGSEYEDDRRFRLLKRRCTSTRLYGAISQTATINMEALWEVFSSSVSVLHCQYPMQFCGQGWKDI
jgi:hypothetical protein